MENISFEFLILVVTLATLLGFFITLTKKVDDIKNEMYKMKDEITNLRVDMNDRMTKIESRLSNVESEVVVLSKLFGRFETDVKVANTKIETVNEKVEKIAIGTENNTVRINKIEEVQIQQENNTNRKFNVFEENYQTVINKVIDKIEIPKTVTN